VSSFEAIPHSGLMSAIEERISDRHLLKLLRAMPHAGVMLDGAVTATGVLVRDADDLLAMCRTRPEAERALAALTATLAELSLELKPAKTRIVHLEEGGQGVDFLGLHHRWGRGNAPRSRHLCSSSAGPHAGRCRTPVTRSGRLPAHARCWYPSRGPSRRPYGTS
jgi:hypothetical protein